MGLIVLLLLVSTLGYVVAGYLTNDDNSLAKLPNHTKATLVSKLAFVTMIAGVVIVESRIYLGTTKSIGIVVLVISITTLYVLYLHKRNGLI